MRTVSYAAEGQVDNAVLLHLMEYVGIRPGKPILFGGDQQWKGQRPTVIVAGVPRTLEHSSGQGLVLEAVALFNDAARYKRWFAITDLDNKFACAGLARQRWLPSPAPYMCFRIAVQEIEAWLIADKQRFAEFLQVDPGIIPNNPEDIRDPKEQSLIMMPKEMILTLAQSSLDPQIYPRLKAVSSYNNEMGKFAKKYWRPAIAAQNSPSLKKCIERLQQLSKGLKVNPPVKKKHKRS